jgi:hypothetical protein
MTQLSSQFVRWVSLKRDEIDPLVTKFPFGNALLKSSALTHDYQAQ